MKGMLLYDVLFAIGIGLQILNWVFILRSRNLIRKNYGRGLWTGFFLLSTFTIMRQALDLGLFDPSEGANPLASLDNRVFPFVMSMLLTTVTVLLILKSPREP